MNIIVVDIKESINKIELNWNILQYNIDIDYSFKCKNDSETSII